MLLQLLYVAFITCALPIPSTMYWYVLTSRYTVAAISPAVTVPTTLTLHSQGYGLESGVPTLIVGAASLDVVIAISLFGIFLGLSFSDGEVWLSLHVPT